MAHRTMNTPALHSAFLAIQDRLGTVDTAVILGSGWSDAIRDWDLDVSLDYASIDVMGATRVEGHAGQLHVARIGGRRHLVFQGRRHWYECGAWEPIAFPVYAAIQAGARSVLLTNAAGGIRSDLAPGNLMIIRDHLNLMGANPLLGPHDSAWGARFPDLTACYAPELQTRLVAAGAANGVTLAQGVYAALSGPCFETAAEVRALNSMGADAVGMSTVPEAILACAAGLDVAALSCIANAAAGTTPQPLSHDDVMTVTRAALPRMAAVVSAYLAAP